MVLALRDRPVADPLPEQRKTRPKLRTCANPRCTDPACHPDLAEELTIGEILPETYLLLAPPAELIISDEPEMESPAHMAQLVLLLTTFAWLFQGRTDIFYAGNASVYWTLETLKKRKLRGPDFFLVRNVTPKARRNSWVVWAEDGRFPEFIVELLSPGTARKDRTAKRELYQNIFQTPEYFWFHPWTKEFMGLRLVDGVYQEIEPTARGYRWSEILGLFLGVKDGDLRLFDADGVMVPTPDEAQKVIAGIERRRADEERQRADEERQRADEEHRRVVAEQQRAETLQRRVATEREARLAAEQQLREALERLRTLESGTGL